MATQAQINANRRNAKLSTGPRTDPGKAAVRQNALRHGFCSGLPLIQDEREKDFQELHTLLLEENQPVGANEELLVYMMAVQMHNFGRANRAIRDALEAGTTELQLVQIPLALRYQATAERCFRQNLSLLRKVQKERSLEEIGFDSQEAGDASAELPPAAPDPPAEAPKTEPVAEQRPVPPPAAAKRPIETQKYTETGVDSPPQTPQKAA